MSIQETGIIGEKIALEIIKTWNPDRIFQADWLVKKDDKWYFFEVKHKDNFMPPPFWGQGMDIYQVESRMQFWKDTGIRCIFLAIDKKTNIKRWQYLDVLENLEFGIDKINWNNIRLYNIEKMNEV